MGEWKKPAAGGVVSGLFGLGIQFVEIPSNWKHAFAFFGLAGALVFFLWLVYLVWQDFKKGGKPPQKREPIGQEDTAKLQISFPVSPVIDPVLIQRVLRVSIENNNSFMLEAVSVTLENIFSDFWTTDVPYEIKSLRMPYLLPATPNHYKSSTPAFTTDVKPGDTNLFDLAYVRVEGGTIFFMGMAPFEPQKNTTMSWRSRDADVKVGSVLEAVKPIRFRIGVSSPVMSKEYRTFSLNVCLENTGKMKLSINHELTLGGSIAPGSLGLSARI